MFTHFFMNTMPESVEVHGVSLQKKSFEAVQQGVGLHRDFLDIAIQDLMERRLRSLGQSEAALKIFVLSTHVTGLIKQGPLAAGRPMPLPQSLASRRFWVPETNIFDLDLVILPFAFPRPSAKKETQYLAAVVDMMSGIITILNPELDAGSVRMDNIMATVSTVAPVILLFTNSSDPKQRIKLMLAFEHRARSCQRVIDFEPIPSAQRSHVSYHCISRAARNSANLTPSGCHGDRLA